MTPLYSECGKEDGWDGKAGGWERTTVTVRALSDRGLGQMLLSSATYTVMF